MKRSTEAILGISGFVGVAMAAWLVFVGSVGARAVARLPAAELAGALAVQPDPRMLDASTPCEQRAALMAEWTFERCRTSPSCAPTLEAGETWRDRVPALTGQLCSRPR